MADAERRAALERIVRRYSRRYERPHAVVEAEQALIDECEALGVTVRRAPRTPGQPYYRRYDLLPLGLTIEGAVNVPNSYIALTVRTTEDPPPH